MIGEAHDFVLEVKDNHTDKPYATGMVFSFPKEDFAPDTDFQHVFRRWTGMNSLCETSPAGNASAKYPQSVFAIAKVDECDVCARLIGGQLDINGYMVTLCTSVIPEGPKGEKLAKYLKAVDKVKIRPRLIYDNNDKITGVPSWDLVLPRDWEEIIYVYNDVEEEDFIEDLQTLIAGCKRKKVGWSMHYAETTTGWHFEIHSAAQSESFIGKNKMLQHALDDAIKHVDQIGK